MTLAEGDTVCLGRKKADTPLLCFASGQRIKLSMFLTIGWEVQGSSSNRAHSASIVPSSQESTMHTAASHILHILRASSTSVAPACETSMIVLKPLVFPHCIHVR